MTYISISFWTISIRIFSDSIHLQSQGEGRARLCLKVGEAIKVLHTGDKRGGSREKGVVKNRKCTGKWNPDESILELSLSESVSVRRRVYFLKSFQIKLIKTSWNHNHISFIYFLIALILIHIHYSSSLVSETQWRGIQVYYSELMRCLPISELLQLCT